MHCAGNLRAYEETGYLALLKLIATAPMLYAAMPMLNLLY